MASKYYTDYSLQVGYFSISLHSSSDSTVAADRLLRLARVMAPDKDVAGILR